MGDWLSPKIKISYTGNVNLGYSAMKRFLVTIWASALSVGAFAGSQNLTTNVTQVYATEEERFGGCLIKTADLIDNNLNCKRAFVSLDCAGVLEGNSKGEGQRRLDVATLAMLTGGKVSLIVTDQAKINGYCLAERVRLLNTGS